MGIKLDDMKDHATDGAAHSVHVNVGKIHDVAIVGAGAGGIAMACNLMKKGMSDFVVFEKSLEVGGCCVPSHMYSFSFDLNPEWSKKYSKQPEIQEYIKRTAAKFGIEKNIRLGHQVVSAAWDDATDLWAILIQRVKGPTPNDPFIVHSRSIIVAPGPFSIPKYPEIDGLDVLLNEDPDYRFQMGLEPLPVASPAKKAERKLDVVHSARWRKDVVLEGKRVAIIGNGASAVQIVPAVGGTVGEMKVYQRTANWVPLRKNYEYTGALKWVFRNVPGVMRIWRLGIYLLLEMAWFVMNTKGLVHKMATWLFLQDLKMRVKDPKLREKLTPKHPVGCKRITPSDRYYETLQQPNVELVTDNIVKIDTERGGVLDASGRFFECDVIVLGTGFDVANPVRGDMRGRGGRDLTTVWRTGGLMAHRGTFIHGFPNFAMLSGPNTGLGHNSQIQQMESQILQIMPFLRRIASREIVAFEPKEKAQKEFNEKLQKRFERKRGLVWVAEGCHSWYQDANDGGRVVALWPGTSTEFLVKCWLGPGKDEFDVR
ncbi:hypothetical protein HDU97_003924 [Phlyctochytrium planicorne]|nr:hypothetical protein HDU97_003924 [Phlyctochytrium planicorne]